MFLFDDTKPIKEENLNLVVKDAMYEYADDIFEALYGSSIEDEEEDEKDKKDKPYYAIYCWEWEEGIVEDVIRYFNFVKINKIEINSRDFGLYLMLCEYNHISNQHLVSKNLNKEKLYNAALSVLKYISSHIYAKYEK